jgi:hypothetical protein
VSLLKADRRYTQANVGGIGNPFFNQWRCVFATFEKGKEIFRERRINVAHDLLPPPEMAHDGNRYVLSDTFPAEQTAYYDASYIVAGLTFDDMEARRVARRLLGRR